MTTAVLPVQEDGFLLNYSDNRAARSPDAPTIVGDDGQALQRNREKAMAEYFTPVSRQRDNVAILFCTLKDEWLSSVSHLSSVTAICMHPAYQKIIGMGKEAVPFILRDLNAHLNHWFWALNAITGAAPVLPEDRGKVKAMATAWLEWGRANGHI